MLVKLGRRRRHGCTLDGIRRALILMAREFTLSTAIKG